MYRRYICIPLRRWKEKGKNEENACACVRALYVCMLEIIAKVIIVFKQENMTAKWLKERNPFAERRVWNRNENFLYTTTLRGTETGRKGERTYRTPVIALRTINLLHYYYYYYMHCTKFIDKN